MVNDDWQRDVERYLAHFLRSSKRPSVVYARRQAQAPDAWNPSVDMYETETAIVVLLELAGVDADQTEVHAEPYLLLVRGVRRERRAPNSQRNYHALEIPYGRFERLVRLPPGTDTSAAHARYHDGLLEITLPKRQPRQVPISLEDET